MLALFAGSAPAVVPAPGYYSFEYASGLNQPTSMAFGPDGTLYVAELSGRIVAVRDTTGDYFADVITPFRTGLTTALGLEWRSGGLFASILGTIVKLSDTNGDFMADVTDTIVAGLPYDIHRNNGITFGPDGLLYVTIGSMTEEAAGDPWAAAIVRFTETGSFVDVFATGMRNPYDLAFYTPKNKLYSTDNSPSGTASFPCYEGPDELNQIVQGGFYGFPDCFGTGDCQDLGCDPAPCGVGSCSRGAGCTGSQLPEILLDTHSAPTGLCFGKGFNGFTERDMFFAEFGSFPIAGCFVEAGRQVLTLRLNSGGNISGGTQPEVFLTDLSRPTDVVVGPDRALYVCDFGEGEIYRTIKIEQTGVGGDTRPGPSRLWASPNPARSHSLLYWEDAPTGEVLYQVFDLAGRRVREIQAYDADPRTWRLTDDSGRRVAAGLYVVRATAGDRSASVKILVTE